MNPMGIVIIVVGLMLVWIGYTGNQSAIFAVITGKKPTEQVGSIPVPNPLNPLGGFNITSLLSSPTNQSTAAPAAAQLAA